MANPSNWITVTDSNFDHEREALEFVRQQFPQHEPYRAWSNFEFIASDGSINEIDLLVFSPQGFFLIEIKSWPGRVSGDAGTWTMEFPDGRRRTYKNPLNLTNLKAKRLKSLLERQRAFKGKRGLPFIEPLVFLSADRLTMSLPFDARHGVCLKDRPAQGDKPERPGIMAAIQRRDCQGLRRLRDDHRNLYSRPISKLASQAMEQAGVRPSDKSRRVSDYVLGEVIDHGPGYQDWSAVHVQLDQSKRRVRFYLVRQEASAEDKSMIARAAKREFQLLESLQHQGIVRAYGFSEHELGPALLLEYNPKALRLDHYLAQRQEPLSIDRQLDLMRQICEAMRFAHEQRVIHRGLNPRSILVTEQRVGRPRIKIINWQLGYRAGSATAGVSHEVTATAHVDRLLEDENTAYLAPEALTDAEFIGEHLDIFSLGAIAFYLFSGQPPAANGLELIQTLRETNGLQISSVLNGADEALQDLILHSTRPNVVDRTETLADFVAMLDAVEETLTQPDYDRIENPNDAQQGDVLEGNLQVLKRLGQGASSIGFLVEKGDRDYVLKVANDPEHNERLDDEAEVLGQLRHSHIVEIHEKTTVGNRTGILMQPVLLDRDKYRIETLGQRIRKDGPLQIDMLQRFGEDLLDVVKYLEEQGINHRDIKPDNIAIGQVGSGSKLHLVLFDFSLSRAARENIKAGTAGYLDPLLSVRQPAQWDSYAERYAVGITLYEMTTGVLPVWGDGVSDPSFLTCEMTLEPERFDADLRDRLTTFFSQAFRRSIDERFDNAEEMLRDWRQCFDGIEAAGALLETEDDSALEALLESATFETSIAALGLGTRVTNVLDRENILTVKALLGTPLRRFQKKRGVVNKTRREIAAVMRILKGQLGTPTLSDFGSSEMGDEADLAAQEASGSLSVDRLVEQIAKPSGKDGESAQKVLDTLLGLGSGVGTSGSLGKGWPTQAEIAKQVGISQARVSQLLGKFHKRWAKTPAVTRLRTDVLAILAQAGGVMTAQEVAIALLINRGSLVERPELRTRQAMALLRAAVAVERSRVKSRFLVQSVGDGAVVAMDKDWASYGRSLGELADELAQADPLVSPERAIQALQEIVLPAEAVPLTERRLLQLAAAVSQGAALSSRQELYPRGMEAERSLRLSQGALYGAGSLTERQVKERVNGRYPEAAKLPGRPELDKLLRQFMPTMMWDGAQGCYVNESRSLQMSVKSTTTFARTPTGMTSVAGREISPEEADARLLEERLVRGIKEGAFLALLATPKRYQVAREEIAARFPVQVVDYEALFLESLRQVANKAGVDWELVLQTDAVPGGADWDKLMLLVGRAMPLVEAELLKATKTILLIYPGLLARYDQMTLLERLREKVGRADGIPGLWVLLANGEQAMIDGKAVPLLSPGQRAKVSDDWLGNRHRAGQGVGGLSG